MSKQDSSKKVKKRGALSWIMEFAGRKRAYFGGSVILAILGVAASFVPYLIIAMIVEQLLAGNREWSYYLTRVLLMALCWLIRMTLHSLSTSLSHATQDGIYRNFITGRKQAVSWKLS